MKIVLDAGAVFGYSSCFAVVVAWNKSVGLSAETSDRKFFLSTLTIVGSKRLYSKAYLSYQKPEQVIC